MNKERQEIIEGIIYAIALLKLQGNNESLEEAVVYYGKDDNVTLEEAREVVSGNKVEKAA